MTEFLSSMSSPEFANYEPDLAFVPVGATEQHGPNLGMGVDYRIAEEIARLASSRCSRRSIVLAPIPFGLSDHHRDFPGTISVSFDAFRSICVDVALSLSRQGVERIVFVNGHMGNVSALWVVVTELKYIHDITAATAIWMQQAEDEAQAHAKTTRWGHACEVECSVASALTPELVKNDALEPGDLIEQRKPYTDKFEPHALGVPLSFSERTRNGALGDATQMSGEAGSVIVEAAVGRLVEFAEAF